MATWQKIPLSPLSLSLSSSKKKGVRSKPSFPCQKKEKKYRPVIIRPHRPIFPFNSTYSIYTLTRRDTVSDNNQPTDPSLKFFHRIYRSSINMYIDHVNLAQNRFCWILKRGGFFLKKKFTL